MVAFARKTTGDASLELLNWDIPFWAERMREAEYNLSDEELRPYFPFPKVLEGLFAVTKRLFDVDVVAADGETQVWNDDVRFSKFEMRRAKTSLRSTWTHIPVRRTSAVVRGWTTLLDARS